MGWCQFCTTMGTKRGPLYGLSSWSALKMSPTSRTCLPWRYRMNWLTISLPISSASTPMGWRTGGLVRSMVTYVIQELGDFVHYLMINPKTSPMTAEEIEMAREDAKKEALNFEKQEDLEVDDDEKPLLPLPPVHGHRMHGKGPGKRKAEQDTPEEEAWTVKWAPLTKNGVLDFLSYCSGQSWKPKTIDNSLSTQPPTVSPAKTIHNLKDSIKWKPIKPGQTLYVLDRIFCQERKNMRVLGLILFFCPCHPPVQSSKQSQDLHCLICSLRSKSARNLPDRMCALCPGFIACISWLNRNV